MRKPLIDMLRKYQNKYIGSRNSRGAQIRLCEFPSEDATWNDYLKRMSKPKEWCDQKMILAACIYFKRKIEIISSLKEQREPIPFNPPTWIDQPENTNPVVLGHYHERHYVGSCKAQTGESGEP
jgi:hypothetical protein